ncbi:hypothetical protein Scep_022816 [Stephania cephalantha]|uniref:Uncharacterized protein n=1 Tax=Stephania cephalantha TaxID=152367 RepID=A0AAP0I180_9MAGN
MDFEWAGRWWRRTGWRMKMLSSSLSERKRPSAALTARWVEDRGDRTANREMGRGTEADRTANRETGEGPRRSNREMGDRGGSNREIGGGPEVRDGWMSSGDGWRRNDFVTRGERWVEVESWRPKVEEEPKSEDGEEVEAVQTCDCF